MLATSDQCREMDSQRSCQLVGGDQGRGGETAFDLADVGAIEVGPFRHVLLRPATLVAQLPYDTRKTIVDTVHMPLPSSRISFLAKACVTMLPGGTLCVSQTLPPIEEPRPIVIRPRMVAPA